jgi:hypothetical protein
MSIHFSELPLLAQSIDSYWQRIATTKPPTLCFDLDDCSFEDIDNGLGIVNTWQNSEEHRNLRAHLHYIALQKSIIGFDFKKLIKRAFAHTVPFSFARYFYVC